ncbi:MAG: hypothetical protein JETCAE02_28660 [Anaerolineaceae bacterium]|nr:MAG: hypothetical protein JETCAE02_28660 [Anaerolineaceae bacterium]
MKLRTISIDGFKGVTDTLSPAACNYLHGPNGSGKSARLLAMRYLALGTTPTGATPEDAMKYLGPLGGSVTIETTDGVRIRRGLSKNARTLELSSDVQVSTMPGAKIKESNEEISRLLGVFPEMIDVREFLGLSPDKRRAFVLSLCGGASAGDRDVIAEIRAALPSEHVTEILEDLRPYATGVNPADSIARVIERAAALVNESKRDAERERLAARKLAERKAELPAVVGTVEELRERLAALRTERDAVIAQRNHQRGRDEAMRAALAEKAAAAAARDSALRELDRLRDAEASATPDAIALFESRVASLHPGPEPVAARRTSALDGLMAAETSARRELIDAERAMDAARRAVDALVDERRAATADPWVAARALFDAALAMMSEDARPPWAALRDHIAARIRYRDAERIERDLAAAEIALADAETTLDKARSLHQQCITAREAESQAIRDDEAAIAAASREWRRRHAEWMTATNDLNRAKIEQERHAAAVRAAREAVSVAESRIRDADAALAALTADTAQIDAALLDQQIVGLDSLIGVAEAEVDALRRRDAISEELDECIRRADDSTIYHETARLVDAAARDVRETMMADLVAPMLGLIRKFLGHVPGLGAAPYCDLATDRDKPVLLLGWARRGTRVPVEQMSGGEYAIFVAAIQFAMIVLRNPPLKIMCIDGSELDATAMDALCAALSACAADLDHVFVASHLPPPESAREWTIVKCHPRVTEADSAF